MRSKSLLPALITDRQMATCRFKPTSSPVRAFIAARSAAAISMCFLRSAPTAASHGAEHQRDT